MKIIIYLTLLSGIVLSQDVITLKSGSTIKGTLDLKSIKNQSIRFMVKGTSKYNFYNKVAIAQIVGSNGKILYPNFIYANSESGLIHQPFVEHIPNKEYLLEFESLDEAESQGFHKCPACFDLRPRVSNYYTEIQLKSALYGSIASSYEVLYEHEKLPVLREALDKVLGSWMEKRKYSDYRIEILKSNYPAHP